MGRHGESAGKIRRRKARKDHNTFEGEDGDEGETTASHGPFKRNKKGTKQGKSGTTILRVNGNNVQFSKRANKKESQETNSQNMASCTFIHTQRHHSLFGTLSSPTVPY